MASVDRTHAAHEMAKVIVDRPDLMEMLRCLASNPVAGEDYMARHAVNVAIYSVVLYTSLKFPAEEIVTIAAATLLHDIGMQAIDSGIVFKKGTLSSEEFDSVKQHTILGKERLSGADDVSAMAAAMANGHHERMDCSGYPRGTNVLPDTIRYLGFLDSFEALTHDRPHRQALAPHEAVCRLTARENSTFDMATRKAFLNAFSFFPVSSIVKLSTGEIGQVVGVNENRPLAPLVRILQSQGGKTGAEGRLVDLSREHLISIVKEIPDRELLSKYAIE
jgi:HD-GYP domain-containing protein (c-di-GMP phosphodiesterase class II)